MEKRRVVITGLGAVTPLGHTARETWEAAKAGVCGIAPITLYDHSAQKVSLAGEVKEFDPSGVLEKKEIRRMDRFAQFAVTAAAEAMAHSGLDLEREDRARIGVARSSGIGGNGTIFMKVALSGVAPAESSSASGTYNVFRDMTAPFGVAIFVPMFVTGMTKKAATGMAVPAAAASALHSVALVQLICVVVGIVVCFLIPSVHKKAEATQE